MHKVGRRSAARKGKLGKAPRRLRVTAQQFRDARVFSGMTREEAASLLGVSLRTIGHWETGATRTPYAAFKLLRVFRHGELPDPRWSGYRIIRGRLVTPEQHELHPGDMAWLSLLVRRAEAFSDLRRACHALCAEVDRLTAGRTGSTRQTPGAGRGRVDHAASSLSGLLGGVGVVECGGGAMPPVRGSALGVAGQRSTSGTKTDPNPPDLTITPPTGVGMYMADSAHAWNDAAWGGPPCSNTGMLHRVAGGGA